MPITTHVAPPPASVFEPVHDCYGLRLALVFGNYAPGGVCPYYAAARCRHCDIGAGEGSSFDVQGNRLRLAWFQRHYRGALPRVAHLVLYNSGSLLNPREMPPELLDELVQFARGLPQLQVISLDTREAYVTQQRIERLAEVLGPGKVMRIILGLESADDRVRNGVLQKQMPRNAVERAFHSVARVASRLGRNRVGIDCNIVIAGPGTTAKTAVDDAVASARFAFTGGGKAGVSVDLNLHPCYPSARGTAQFPGHPRCPVSLAARATVAIDALRRRLRPQSVCFVGWQDEGHDRQQSVRARELARAAPIFEVFNRAQDPTVFEQCH